MEIIFQITSTICRRHRKGGTGSYILHVAAIMFVWSTCLTFSGRLVSRSPMAVSCNLVCDIFIVFSIDLMSREAGATPITIFVVADLDSEVGLSLVQSVLSLIVCHGLYPTVLGFTADSSR